MPMAMTDRPTAPGALPAPPRVLRCRHCGRGLGHIAGGVFHEPGGDKSALPIVRRCRACGTRNVKLTA